MQCTNPILLLKNIDRKEYPEGLNVPCGKCLNCRIKKRKEWSLRMLHELDYHKDSSFITLTYDNNHMPENKTLVKSDLQKFFKRLRKNLGDRKIKYFACGEYGEPSRVIQKGLYKYVSEGERPHYHCIIFGLSIRPEDQLIVNSSWRLGNVDFGLAEPDSINYVAQYIDKKYSGDKEISEYISKNRINVFRLLSLGIGSQFVTSNSDILIENQSITMWGKKLALPRYYIKKLQEKGFDISTLKQNAYERECNIVSHYTGLDYSEAEAYRILKPEELIKMYDGIKKAKAQRNATSEKKVSMKERKY